MYQFSCIKSPGKYFAFKATKHIKLKKTLIKQESKKKHYRLYHTLPHILTFYCSIDSNQTKQYVCQFCPTDELAICIL